ncbi:organic cation transporter protein-like isoform X2 [Haliotis rufescens]|nr:organic cation transporter protein-like isoform X2 [Haliotis rufescens]XP_046357183.1 organic cation transporter protein-like isoform X2 [Haliotis rufescens]XP_046357184.1 organic cation transporter protein-like isoform X2 [Haliotis rufescens]
MEVDIIQKTLGGYGCYQMLVYTLLGLMYMRGAWHTFNIIFLGAVPAHTCTVANRTVDNSLQIVAGECDVALMVSNATHTVNETDACSAWQYDSMHRASSIVSEWDLVCNKNYLVELSTTIYMIGSASGAVILTPFSDRFGRKRLLLSCLCIQAVIGFAVAFVQNYVAFTLLRAVVGFLNMGIALSAYVMMTEVFPASHRTLPSIAMQIFWAVGVMLLSLFAYLVRDWRHLEMLVSLPNVLAIVYIWCLPESLPWLLSQKKIRKAKAVIRWAVKLNKLPSNMVELLEPSSSPTGLSGQAEAGGQGKASDPLNTQENSVTSASNSKTLPGILDLVKTPRIRLYAILMWYLFFVNSLSYFGLSFSTPNLHGNPYLNLCLMGAVEIPAYAICMLVINWLGRRVPVCVFLLICGVTNIAAIFVPADCEELSYLKLTILMIGKFGITGSYSTIYLLAAEIFPTSVRNQAVGIASFFENIGSISAPLIVYVAKKIPELPFVVFGVLTIIGAGVVLLLPETRHRPLPETIEEIEGWHRKPTS